ncbi:cobalamin B12-binding domain-containing protein [Clostridium luticellarii]|jgi:methanogenic corrinoid protein MtbC1|uniref:Methionine synthase n=1 Tax=Clostridium luticellarii TaxID=1691940 RepID=A0A2T0BKU9_9CLOT|nr:Methionine synthase [Clostridium luticellarii]
MDYKLLTQAVGDLDEDKVFEMLKDFVNSNPEEEEAQKVVNACQDGMATVGDLFDSGEYFVGDLIFAGELLNNAIDVLKPVIGSESSNKLGTIVLGTVQGDLHDIGKNIFKSMAEAAGFEVYDIGIDQSAAAFIDKIKEVNPQIVGMSGVLTLAIDSMKNIVNEIEKENLKDKVKIIIGGNPVTKEACEHVRADAFTTNAAEGVKICKEWVS